MRYSMILLCVLILLGLSAISARAAITTYEATGVTNGEFFRNSIVNGVQNGSNPFTGENFTAFFNLDTSMPLTRIDAFTGEQVYVYTPSPADVPVIRIDGAYLSSFGFGSSSLTEIGVIPFFYYTPGSEVFIQATYPALDGTGYLQFDLPLTSPAKLNSGNLADLPALSSSAIVPPSGVTVSVAVPEPGSIAIASIGLMLGFGGRVRRNASR